ncbi:MAG: calcium:proton antiporter [Armatimonadota bacterium]
MKKILRFIKEEKSLILAAITALIILFFDKSIISNLGANKWLTLLKFLWFFLVIIIGAIGVVKHAETLAHKTGEPLGTLILTLSAVSIEVIMISIIMLHTKNNPTMARDTIYATLMIILNAQIGLAMLFGGLKHGAQHYNFKSSRAFFSMIITIAGIAFFLPMVIHHESLYAYRVFLIFPIALLYLIFLHIQTKEHRYFFTFESKKSILPSFVKKEPVFKGMPYHMILLFLLLLSIAYVGEKIAVIIDYGVDVLNLPVELASLVVAILILSPEALTAILAGTKDHMQRVMNISLGSALSTMSLTIPAIIIISIIASKPVILALTLVQAVLLGVTMLVSMNSYGSGETTSLSGAVQLVLFITFIVLLFV